MARAQSFCDRFALRCPILLAPIAGACPPALSIAVASAGGMGACGALLMQPEAIAAWVGAFRRAVPAEPAGETVRRLWDTACALLA